MLGLYSRHIVIFDWSPIMNLLPLGGSLFLLITTFRPITLSVISSSHSIDAPSMIMLFWISGFSMVEPSPMLV